MTIERRHFFCPNKTASIECEHKTRERGIHGEHIVPLCALKKLQNHHSSRSILTADDGATAYVTTHARVRLVQSNICHLCIFNVWLVIELSRLTLRIPSKKKDFQSPNDLSFGIRCRRRRSFLNQVLAAQFSVVSWCTFRGWSSSSSFGFLRTVPPSCNTPNLASMKTLMFYLHFLHFSSSQNQRKNLGCYQISRKANVHQCGNATEKYFAVAPFLLICFSRSFLMNKAQYPIITEIGSNWPYADHPHALVCRGKVK